MAKRVLVAFRIAPDGLTHLDARAADEGLFTATGEPNRSELIRKMLTYAMLHMPKGWTR